MMPATGKFFWFPNLCIRIQGSCVNNLIRELLHRVKFLDQRFLHQNLDNSKELKSKAKFQIIVMSF